MVMIHSITVPSLLLLQSSTMHRGRSGNDDSALNLNDGTVVTEPCSQAIPIASQLLIACSMQVIKNWCWECTMSGNI